MSTDPATALAAAERAAAAPFVNRRPTSWWLLIGFAAVIGADVMLLALPTTALRIVGLILIAVAVGALIGSMHHLYGAIPRFSSDMPAEFRSLYVGYYLLVLGVITAAFIIALGMQHAIIGGLVAFVGTLAVLVWYERRDRVVAEAVRARLALEDVDN